MTLCMKVSERLPKRSTEVLESAKPHFLTFDETSINLRATLHYIFMLLTALCTV